MGEEISHYVYANWIRFVDDCYINWPYGEDKLKELHDILNIWMTAFNFLLKLAAKNFHSLM